MYLYVYKGFRGGRDRQAKTDELILRSVAEFAAEKEIELGSMPQEVFRTDKGKPYFKEISIEFSVSHTDDLWVCLISTGNTPVGVDIQKVKETSQRRIADRYFTDDEKVYLAENGTDAFFEIWTRKEAYAKYTGKGITKELSEISTVNSAKVRFIGVDIREDVKCSCCVSEEGDLCLRVI